MKPVTRLFLISSAWTLASYMASSFMSAWFWDIGSGIKPIILFYTILFIAMTTSFALSTQVRARFRSSSLMAAGILLNIAYLALLLGLQSQARHYLSYLAAIEGLASSFYWLALFVLASSWVAPEQSDWYNGWTGTLEAILGLIAPPLSGWIIVSLPHLEGYRAIFAISLVCLVLSLVWVLMGRRKHEQSMPTDFDKRQDKTEDPPAWRALLWSFWALGMRDGMFFFIPNLLLYIVTRNAVLLGLYITMQAALEGLIFWGLARWSRESSRLLGMRAATLISFLGLGMVLVPLDYASLFGLGVLVAIAYPFYKVALESSALNLIGRHSRGESDRVRFTGAKESWINAGRLISLLLLLVVLTIVPHFSLPDFRWILGGWSLIPFVTYMSFSVVAKKYQEVVA